MSGIMGPLGAIGNIFGVIKQLIPLIQKWFAAQRAQSNAEKAAEAVKNPDRQDAAREMNDILRGVETPKPAQPQDTPKPPPASMGIIVLLAGGLLSSCSGQNIRFNPDFCAGDYTKSGCVRENGVFYPANAPAFNREFCMDQQKVLELAELLGNANGISSKGRNYLGEVKGDVRTSEKKEWVGLTQDQTQWWMLELRRQYRERRLKNAEAGVDSQLKGEPSIEELSHL